jgi:spore germination protein YaaH
MGNYTARILTEIPDNQRSNFIFYSVRKGDTLVKVAAKFNISVDDLLKINNMSKSDFYLGA